jgi:uncharacterized Zn-finger protein
MDQDLKAKIDAILNSKEKKSPEEHIATLLNNQSFITLEKIKSLIHDKKRSVELYEQLKQQIKEFYIITYKDYPIQCGWSDNLELNETRYYCKALDEYFLLSKNKIHYSLVNNNPKFSEIIKKNLELIEAECLKNS